MTVNEEKKRILVTIPKRLYLEFDRIVRSNGLRKSDVITRLLTEWCEKQKKG